MVRKQTAYCRQLTCPGQRFVERALVDAGFGHFAVADGDEPEGRHVREELLGTGLGQHLLLSVPARALGEQAPDVAAIFRCLLQGLPRFFQHLSASVQSEPEKVKYEGKQ